MGWAGHLGIQAALLRRATEGGSYRVHVCLSRVSMWMHTMGIFDQNWAGITAEIIIEHRYTDPETFKVMTPCGVYQGVTEQVKMSETLQIRHRAYTTRFLSSEWKVKQP